MGRKWLVIICVFGLMACDAVTRGDEAMLEYIPQSGQIDSFTLDSSITDGRGIEVWLPPGYSADSETRYPVLYMHDGQNVFNPETSYSGVAWGADVAMTKLIDEQAIRPAIIVAIHNTPKRAPEYIPLADDTSDKYLDFITQELVPHINAHYQTLAGPDNTFIMGSSLGGLISAYAMIRHPDVFGGAGCVSTHWPVYDQIEHADFIHYIEQNPLDPTLHKFYFDYGTEGLDAEYKPFQLLADDVMRKQGYAWGSQWLTYEFSGHDHHESDWARRLEIPITFLLKTE